MRSYSCEMYVACKEDGCKWRAIYHRTDTIDEAVNTLLAEYGQHVRECHTCQTRPRSSPQT